MKFLGRIFKDGKHWLGEIPALDAMTQGHSREDVVRMVEDMLETLVNEKGFQVRVDLLSNNQIVVVTSDTPALFGLLLQRQRMKSGLSQADAAKLLGFTSVNAYAAYEQGKREPSLSKAQELLEAVSKVDRLNLSIA
jgi:DNA-binding XRE family transcriptional regulator